MSVTGTDLQTLIMRSPEVGKMQQAPKTEEQVANQNFATGLKKQSESAGETIQNPPKTEQGKINRDQDKQEKQALQQRDGREQDEGGEEDVSTAPDADASGQIIDFRI